MFFSTLMLLLKFYNRINPFKEFETKKYIFSFIFLGFLVDKSINFFTWKVLQFNEINSTLNQQRYDTLISKNPNEQFQIAITSDILAPIGEEIFNRGALLCFVFFLGKVFGLQKKTQYICFVVASYLIFGLGHDFDTLLTTLPYAVSALVLSFAYLYSKSIIVPIGIHMLNNSIITIADGKDANIILAVILLALLSIFVEIIQYSNNISIQNFKFNLKNKIDSWLS